MNRYILSLIAATLLLTACKERDWNGQTISGQKAVVSVMDSVVFESPCGYVEVENPTSATNGGDILSGAAVSSHPFVTVTWSNKHPYRYNQFFGDVASPAQIIRTFPLSGDLAVKLVPCTGTISCVTFEGSQYCR